MRAVGVAMTERGARTDEYRAAMHALWATPAPAYHGRYVTFEGIDAHPRPLRPGWLGRLEISFLPLVPEVHPDTAQQYADLGADRLVLYPPSLHDPAQVEAFLRHHAGLLP